MTDPNYFEEYLSFQRCRRCHRKTTNRDDYRSEINGVVKYLKTCFRCRNSVCKIN